MDIVQLLDDAAVLRKTTLPLASTPHSPFKRASRGGHHWFRKCRTTAHLIVPPIVFTAALPQGEPLRGRLNARSLFQRSSIVSSSA
jgi:hypothetical protein